MKALSYLKRFVRVLQLISKNKYCIY